MKSQYPILKASEGSRIDKTQRLRSKVINRLKYFEKHVSVASHVSCSDLQAARLKYWQNWCPRACNILDSYIKTRHRPLSLDRKYAQITDIIDSWPLKRDHLEKEFGIVLSSVEKDVCLERDHFLERLAKGALDNSTDCHRFRLENAFRSGEQKRQFMMFNTLTVSPENYDEVFHTGSLAFRDYIKAIEYEQVKHLPREKQSKARKKSLQYFAVVEEGGTTGRLHIHCILFMSNIMDLIDPAIGRPMADDSDVHGMKRFWKYGKSMNLPIRFNEHDAWAQHDWKWPLDHITKQPKEGTCVEKITKYMVKYVTKSQLNKGKPYQWKTRSTRNLGLKPFSLYLRKIKPENLISMISLPKFPMPLTYYGSTMPNRILRYMLVSELARRLNNPWIVNKLTSDPNTTFEQLAKCTTSQRCARSYANIIRLQAKLLNPEGISNEPGIFHEFRLDAEKTFLRREVSTAISSGKLK